MTMPEDPWVLPAWADLSEIVTAALSILRIDPADVDVTRMEPYASVAVRRIESFLDPDGGATYSYPPPPELAEAAVTVTIRLYRQKDAPFGVAGGWTDNDTGPVYVPADALKPVYDLLRPLKLNSGVA